MPWSKSTPGLPEIDSIEECVEVVNGEVVVLFKHSATCPVSWMAQREVLRYRSAEPDIPVYLVSVRRHRDVSRHISELTGIQHESPQVIVFRRGKAIAATSHDDITAEAISAFVAGALREDLVGLNTIVAQDPVPSADPCVDPEAHGTLAARCSSAPYAISKYMAVRKIAGHSYKARNLGQGALITLGNRT